VPLYRERLATTEANLAQVQHRLGRNADAQQHAQVGLNMTTDLVAAHPEVLEYHIKHAFAVMTLGQILRDTGDFTLAETAFSQGIEKCNTLLEDFPTDSGLLRLRGHGKNNLGVLQLLTGAFEPARQSFASARNDFDAAIQLSEGDILARDGLAWSVTYLGDALRQLDRAEEAKTFYREASDGREALDGDPEYRYRWAWFLVHCEDPEFRDPSLALDIGRQLALQVPNNADYLTLEAAALYRLGQWEQCLAKADEAEIVGVSRKSPIDFWRAMALWQSGKRDQALIVRQRAEERMTRNAPGDLKLVNLQAEMMRLMESDEEGEKE
jgi:tetratricopeptide (TPR) repeat protein